MPTQLATFGAGTFDGTAADDFLVVLGSDDTVNGLDGDDFILGDSSSNWLVGTTTTQADPFNLDLFNVVWTIDENPFIANATTTPHTSLYVVADAGQSHYSSVTVGNGETITIDIDFGNAHPIGVNTDSYVEIYNSLGVLVASSDDADVTLGGAGSVHTWRIYTLQTR